MTTSIGTPVVVKTLGGNRSPGRVVKVDDDKNRVMIQVEYPGGATTRKWFPATSDKWEAVTA